MEWRKGDYVISDDPARLDVAAVHKFLTNDAYWEYAAKASPDDWFTHHGR